MPLRIPQKITPDPIIDSVVELRFQTSIQEDLVFTVLFNELSKDLKVYKENQIRPQNGPHFGTLYGDYFGIGLSPKSIVFSCKSGYKGWSEFYPFIKKYVNRVAKLNIISKIDRVGIRYMNFFKGMNDLLAQHVNFKATLNSEIDYSIKRSNYNAELFQEPFSFNVNMSDNVLSQNDLGSLIDIDAFIDKIDCLLDDRLLDIIDKAHMAEKALFFSILKAEFIETLNPEYND